MSSARTSNHYAKLTKREREAVEKVDKIAHDFWVAITDKVDAESEQMETEEGFVTLQEARSERLLNDATLTGCSRATLDILYNILSSLADRKSDRRALKRLFFTDVPEVRGDVMRPSLMWLMFMIMQEARRLEADSE